MRWAVAVCLLGALGPLLFAQDGGSSLPAATPPVARYGFSGRVVNAVTGEGVGRAKVSFYSGEQQATLSGPDGSFHFDGAPAGQMSVVAEKPGYFAEMMLPDTYHAPELVTVSAQMTPVVVKLVPAAVVTGSIREGNGDPVAQLPVMMLRRTVQSGKIRWAQVGYASSDEEGEFRVPDVMPGTYLLRYGPRWTTSVFTEGKTKGYAAEFYPSAATEAAAAPLKLGAGQILPVEITVRQTTPITVSGTIAGLPDGSYPAVEVFDEDGEAMPAPEEGATRRDAFTLHFAAPGTYKVRVTARAQAPPGVEPPLLLGETTLAVNASLAGVTIALGPAASFPIAITETHVRAQEPTVPVANQSPVMQNLRLVSVDSANNEIAATLEPKGKSLSFRDVFPGTYRLYAYPDGQRYLESATLAGRDILHEPFTVRSGETGVIEVKTSDDGATVTGLVNGIVPPATAAAGGVISAGYRSQPTVLLFSEAGESEQPQRAGAEQGNFQFPGIAPGSYKVYAFDHPDEVEYRNPAVMERYAGDAVSVTLGAGEQKNVNLNLIRVNP